MGGRDEESRLAKSKVTRVGPKRPSGDSLIRHVQLFRGGTDRDS